MGVLTLVVGGVRSGKSRFAEGLAAAHPVVTYLATADAAASAGDDEMARRIAEHRRRRAARAWRAVEEPWEVAAAVAAIDRATDAPPPGPCVLLECLTLWVAN